MSKPLILLLQMLTLRLRWATLVVVAINLAASAAGFALRTIVLRHCSGKIKIPVTAASILGIVRVAVLAGAGIAQCATAKAIAGSVAEEDDDDCRRCRRVRYRRWLWWTRFGMVVTALQFVMALYVMFIVVKDISYTESSSPCFLGQDAEQSGWKKILMISYLTTLWLVVILQCVTGSDVLRWRSFYATHDTAWKAHYREVFDHGIREALCCMGRVKYLSVLEEDEVYSVARLLGDLVAYRASGTGHLEFLAGLALLQKRKKYPNQYGDLVEAPEELIQEAALFHRFSEAAYTGPLLDFGRNPVLFPCAWLHRQGVLTPWTRNRRPVLEGDNWWRGHAAAFLKCVNLSPEALRKGRVQQQKRESAYFVVVLHDIRSVVVAVRGTETPEDLITDGLCRECNLTVDDLDGLLNSEKLSEGVSETVLATFPHYGHSGIVESARELFSQVDGHPGKDDNSPSKRHGGFLSSLLDSESECHGYRLIIVGHSLGGAVATLLGIRLFAKYPNLHVYAYGALPCVDSVIAEACSDFVTSIVYNDEFSARLSVNSILRLRAASIAAMSDDSSAESALISKLTRRILTLNRKSLNSSIQSNSDTIDEGNPNIYKRKSLKYAINGGAFLCGHAVSCIVNNPNNCASSQIVDDDIISSNGNPSEMHVNESISDFTNTDMVRNDGSDSTIIESSNDLVPNEVSNGDAPEVYLAGLVVHIVPEEKGDTAYWKSWLVDDRSGGYKAVIANRDCFKDIVVSPYMFLDHLPWRCHYALQRVLETRKVKAQLRADLLTGDVLV